MSKADTTATRSQGAPKGSSALPSIAVLGQHMAAVERARMALDRGEYDAPDDRMADIRRRERMDFLLERAIALERLIGTMQPVTLADAAVAAHVASSEAAGLGNIAEMGEVERNRRLGAIESTLCAIVPIIAEAAGLDLEAMDLAGNVGITAYRFAGLEVVA